MKIIKTILSLFLLVVLSSCADKYPDLKEGMYADIQTEKGTIVVQLYFEDTPNTVANFVSLATGTNNEVSEDYKGKPFYDGLKFHRVIEHFMIQGGDPEGTGSGGTGYKFEDEFPVDKTGSFLHIHDAAGVLSMANSGYNTNSSQFFITHNATPHLDGKHTVFGQVVKGQEVVDAIKQGDVMTKIEIIRKGSSAKKFDAAKVFSAHLSKFEDKLKRKAAEKINRAKKSQEVIQKMAAFIADKKTQAKQYPSGLRTYMTKRGIGKKPITGEVVEIDYAGYFESGQLFSTSVLSVAKKFNHYDEQRDQSNGYHPFQIIYSKAAELIPGFKEGILNMNYGDKMLLFIPAHLAYGEEGNTSVPPNTDLVFEVEIINR